MCMEDVRLGRKTGPIAAQFAPALATRTKIADQNPNRIAIMFGVVGANAAMIAPAPLDPTANQGMHLSQAEGMITLDIQHHGNIVTQQWDASGLVGATNITVWESILNDQ